MVQTTMMQVKQVVIPAADNTAVFTNTYIAGEIVVDDTDLQFTKVFTGKDWNKENFEFTLTPTGGKDDEGIEITPQDVPMPDITKDLLIHQIQQVEILLHLVLGQLLIHRQEFTIMM